MNLKEEIIAIIKSADYEPMSVSDFQDALGLSSADSFRDLIKILVELEQTGMVTRTKQDRYQKQQQKTNSGLVRGTLSQNKKGFAFLRPDDQEMEDIFIPPTKINRAMDGDVVLVEVKKSRGDFRKGKFEGEVKAIESHSIKQVVGTFSEARHFGFVVPDDKRIMQDIFVPKGQELGAVEGHKVLVQITQYSDGTNSPEGQISAILGHKNDPGVDILSIIYQHGIEIEFPDDVLKEAENVPETQPDELKGRRDLRDELTITIDGADAKDLDDAIAVKKLDNGNTELTVSIADVSYYVTEGSALDREAYDRATSVYLVDRVIPMIPHRLSNGICSLNPEVDRLAMSCRMEIDAQGQVVKHEIFESVIHSNARMTYDAVNRIITDKDAVTRAQYPEIVPMLDLAQTLSQQLIAMRKKRGEIDFDIKEAKVIVNEEGIPKEVVTRERGEGERLIESFMLIANETVAEHFNQMEVPFIYRIHEQPKSERLRQFFDFITNFGIMVKGTGEDIHPSTLQNIHEEIAGRPEDMVISTMMLRSMQQARYDADNLGHFGLAADYYTHFTSPIRRYPDLIVHRLVRKYLIEKSMDGRAMHEWEEKLPQIAEHTSNRERRAIDAERDTDELKKAEFMIQHIGDEFEGVISSVANFGMFVELPNTIEGMVNMQNMSDDYYHFDERQMALIGERKAKVYRIGDVVKVKVIHVDVDERQIDFQIVGMPIDVSSKRERDPRGKTIQAKTKGTQFEKTDKKKKRKSRKGKNARQRDKSGNTQHKPFYKGKKVKKKARKKKK
ncbi:ribonuclease R [Staphylococcus pseudintermedius]|uniref:ribonuclease R n=1 Tax=Staphylococcus pseudintermedius TaxID=283734 RepID=UPI0028862C2B|nr:ribonuclease R [Staphylococcus pseudintermedius]MDT0778500.1 ribonuclease R [Staphylococcus pseudintermedius]